MSCVIRVIAACDYFECSLSALPSLRAGTTRRPRSPSRPPRAPSITGRSRLIPSHRRVRASPAIAMNNARKVIAASLLISFQGRACRGRWSAEVMPTVRRRSPGRSASPSRVVGWRALTINRAVPTRSARLADIVCSAAAMTPKRHAAPRTSVVAKTAAASASRAPVTRSAMSGRAGKATATRTLVSACRLATAARRKEPIDVQNMDRRTAPPRGCRRDRRGARALQPRNRLRDLVSMQRRLDRELETAAAQDGIRDLA